MSLNATIHFQDPSSSKEVEVGAYVAIRLGIKNTGDERGNILAWIRKDGVVCAEKFEDIDPGSVVKLYGSDCDITMPDKVVTIDFSGWYWDWDSNSWIFGDSCLITLTPKTVPCTCGLWIDKDCESDCYRRQTRTCSPIGCDIESRLGYDESCCITPAKGQIDGEPTYPTKVKEGEGFQVSATGKNIGGVGANFRFRLFEGATEIAHGGWTYRGLGKTFSQTLSGIMPNRNLDLTLKLLREI